MIDRELIDSAIGRPEKYSSVKDEVFAFLQARASALRLSGIEEIYQGSLDETLHRRNDEIAAEMAKLVTGDDLDDSYDGVGDLAHWIERAALLRCVDRDPLNDWEFAEELGEGSDHMPEVLFAWEQDDLRSYVGSRLQERGEEGRRVGAECADEVLSDCCRKEFIAKYHGRGSLQGWIRTAAYNRARNAFRKDKRIASMAEVPEDSSYQWREGDESALDVDPAMVGAAVVRAFTLLKQQFPRWLVVVRLSYLHEVSGKRLAVMLQRQASEVSRDKTAGVQFLHTEFSTYLEARGIYLTWEETLQLLSNHLDLMHDEDAEEFGGAG